MKYYINYNTTTGAIVTRYVSGIHDSEILTPPAGTANLLATDSDIQLTMQVEGYTVVNGLLVAPPAPTSAQLVATAKATQIALLTSACGTTITSGFISSALGTAYTYPSKPNDQANLVGAVTAGISVNTWVMDKNGTWSKQLHTAAQIKQVLVDGATAYQMCSDKLATLIDNINTATTVADVQAIVW
jgi:hypothetical protein